MKWILYFFFALPQLLEFDKEKAVFKDRLLELDISFPPRYELLFYPPVCFLNFLYIMIYYSHFLSSDFMVNTCPR